VASDGLGAIPGHDAHQQPARHGHQDEGPAQVVPGRGDEFRGNPVVEGQVGHQTDEPHQAFRDETRNQSQPHGDGADPGYAAIDHGRDPGYFGLVQGRAQAGSHRNPVSGQAEILGCVHDRLPSPAPS